MGIGGPFLGGKARSGRDAGHSPPSSAEVKYEKELYLLSHHVSPWHVAGQLYFLLSFLLVIINVPSIVHISSGTARCNQRDLKVSVFVSYKWHLIRICHHPLLQIRWLLLRMKSYCPEFAICGPLMCFLRLTYILVILYHPAWWKNTYRGNIYVILSE
jgi:hypothetical protein